MISAHNHAKSMHQLEQIMIGQQQHQNQDHEDLSYLSIKPDPEWINWVPKAIAKKRDPVDANPWANMTEEPLSSVFFSQSSSQGSRN